MMRTLRPASTTYVAYVLFLMVFVALGVFVFALAARSGLAAVAGGILAALMVASVVGFRVGARNRARSNDSGIEIEGANIWEQPLRREEIDRYLATYRSVPQAITAEPTLRRAA